MRKLKLKFEFFVRPTCRPLLWHTYRYITSDCDAVATIFEYQNYTKTHEDSAAGVLKAGFCHLFLIF